MNIRDRLQAASHQLREAGVPDPEWDAGSLLAHVTGIPRMEWKLHGLEALSPEQEQRFSSLLLSRASRTPLQYLIGTQYFYGLPFQVDARVLVPRPETERLCELALAHLQAVPSPRVLDLCTGSGAIAVTIQHECPTAKVFATDLSADALAVARKNAEINGVPIQFLQGDLFAPVQGERFHCILSNPPYILSGDCKNLQAEVQKEPLLALDGGADGLDFYRRIAAEAPQHLHPHGFLGLEIGDTQAEAVCALLKHTGCFAQITVANDLGGLPRVVCAYALSSPT